MHRRALLIVLAAALATCPSALAAQRMWFPPQTIGGPAMVNPQAAVDRDGNTFVLFAHGKSPFDVIHASARPAGGDFSPPAEVKWMHAFGVGLAGVVTTFDSQGRALLIWRDNRDQRNPILYATHDPKTERWRMREFGHSEASVPVAQPDGRGNVLAAWGETHDPNRGCCVGPYVATMNRGDAFGEARKVGDRSSSILTLDVARSGVAALGWADLTAGFMTTVRSQDGDFGPAEEVPGGSVGISGSAPQLSIDNGGEVLFALRSYESRGAMQPPVTRVVVVVRRPDGRYLEPQTLSVAENTSEPRIAAGPAGEAVIAWTEGEQQDATLRFSVRGPDGRFSAPVTIADGRQWMVEPQIGMDDVGNAIVTWTAHHDGEWTIYAAHRPPHSGFGPPHAISNPGIAHREDVFPDPRLTVGGPGNAIVTWHRFPADASDVRIEAAVFDVDRPTVPKFEVKPGKGLTFSWQVSEETETAIEVRQDGTTLRSYAVAARVGANRRRVRRGDLPAGRYRAVLRATDALGHRSKRRYARFSLAPR